MFLAEILAEGVANEIIIFTHFLRISSANRHHCINESAVKNRPKLLPTSVGNVDYDFSWVFNVFVTFASIPLINSQCLHETYFF